MAVLEVYEYPHPVLKKKAVKVEKVDDALRKLMDDIVVEQEAKRRSEMDALQSQINPHFLYNTLDSIHWRAMAGGNEEI